MRLKRPSWAYRELSVLFYVTLFIPVCSWEEWRFYVFGTWLTLNFSFSLQCHTFQPLKYYDMFKIIKFTYIKVYVLKFSFPFLNSPSNKRYHIKWNRTDNSLKAELSSKIDEESEFLEHRQIESRTNGFDLTYDNVRSATDP